MRTVPARVRVTAVAVVVVGVVVGVAAIWLDIDNRHRVSPVGRGWVGAVPGILMLVTGGLLLVRVGGHRVAVLLTGAGVWLVSCGLAAAWINHAAPATEGPVLDVAVILNQRLSTLAYAALPALLAIFPTGRLPQRPVGRILATTSIVLALLPGILPLLMPWSAFADAFGTAPNVVLTRSAQSWGLHLAPETWRMLSIVASVSLGISLPLAAFALASRARGADAATRLQLRWVTWAGGLSSFLLVGSVALFPYDVAVVVLSLCVASMCVAVWVSVGRHGLYDIDRVISWTLVYAVLATSVVAVDALLVAVLGRTVKDNNTVLAAVAIVLLAYAPVREWMLTNTRRLVAGRRGDPYGAMSALAASLENADDAGTQLSRLAASVARTFATPYVAVHIDLPDGDRLSANHGKPTAQTMAMPISSRDEVIGVLEIAPGRAQLSARDQRLLTDLIRHATAAVRATSASRELEEIRNQLVLSREAERRVLRRELHDGLGPQLAAVKMRIEAAGNMAGTDPDASRRLLEAATHEITNAVEEVRRLSRGLGPAAVEDVGLVRALEQLTGRFDATLDCDEIDVLPPAYEVAIYRIVGEALTNAHRHAAATRIGVELRRTEAGISVHVHDDGRGIGPQAVDGVGIRSMRIRAQELGGHVDLHSTAQGCVVIAVLPNPAGETVQEVDA